MSTPHRFEKTENGSDGSDALAEPLENLALPGEQDKPAEVDPFVAEYGALFSADGETIHANQIALAAKFSVDHEVCFDPKSGKFLIYSPATGTWDSAAEPAVKVALARFIKVEAEKNNATEFVSKRTNGFLNAVLQLHKGFAFPTSSTLRPTLVHVGNGMLDVSVNPPALGDFNPSHFSTRRCAVAYRSGADCPRFISELLGPALSGDDTALLQRFFGAALLGGNAAQRFLIVHGEAARGKSTLITLMETVIGIQNVAHLRTDHLPGRFETHGYQGKTLLTAKDVPGDFLNRRGAQMIKSLVGADLIESEQKYGGKFQMRGDFNIIVTTNNRLRLAVEEDEAAWRRRMLVVRFEGGPPKQRVNSFAETLLRDEAEGILAWMVDGATQHLAELEEIGDFRLTPAQQARIDDLLLESQSPAVFIRERVAKDKGKDTTVEELTQGYLDFCAAKRWEPFRSRQFANELSDLMQKFHRVLRRNDISRGGKMARGFKHVSLQTPENTSKSL